MILFKILCLSLLKKNVFFQKKKRKKRKQTKGWLIQKKKRKRNKFRRIAFLLKIESYYAVVSFFSKN